MTYDNSLCSFTAPKNEQNTLTTTKQPHVHKVIILTFYMSTEHAFDESAVLLHYEFHVYALQLVQKHSFILDTLIHLFRITGNEQNDFPIAFPDFIQK